MRSSLCVAVSAVLLLATGEAVYAVRVDRVVGATSSGGSCFVKRFSVPAGTVVVGAELVSNDPGEVFPRVMLLEGQGTTLRELRRIGEVRNVRAVNRHVLQVVLPAVTIDGPRDLYVAVTLPASAGISAVGEGPGLGAMMEGAGNCFIASADDGLLQPIDVDLCIRLVLQNPRKTSVTTAEASLDVRPNPFNPSTAMSFVVPAQALVELAVYSVDGRMIRSVTHEELPAGSYTRDWDSRDAQGRLVSGGVYVAKLTVGSAVLTKRLILVK